MAEFENLTGQIKYIGAVTIGITDVGSLIKIWPALLARD